jgi:hypothetical protein
MEDRIQKLKSGRGIFNFEGCLVTQIIGGWQVFGQNLSTPEEVLALIDNAGIAIEKSIVTTTTVKNTGDGSISCSNSPKLADKGTGGTMYPCEGI